MRVKLKPLAEQVMVITGASSGIGLATARKAAGAGARVVLVARGEPALRAAVEGIVADGGRAAYAVADVGELAQVEAAAAVAAARFGPIDTWVNNAGVAIYSDLVDTPRDEHERLFRTVYWGAVNGAQTAVAAMRAEGGALITVGSIASDMGSPVMGAYAAAKHAVKGYMDSLRIELQRDHVPVSVTLVKPSGIGTPLGEHVANHLPGDPKVPPPVYSPDLVAEVILQAAEHPMREQIVGGAGAVQVFAATHVPELFSRAAGMVTGLLNDRSKPASPGDNLFAPMSDARSYGAYPGRRLSLYRAAHLHPVAAAAVGVGLAATALSLLRRSSTTRRGA